MARQNKPTGTKLLLKLGADPNIADCSGNTPLHAACSYGCVGNISALVRHGANLDAKNSAGDTPLMELARRGTVSAMKRLLKAGADMSAVNNKGQTAMDILQKKHYSKGEEFFKYIREIKVRAAQERLQKEDCDMSLGSTPDFSI